MIIAPRGVKDAALISRPLVATQISKSSGEFVRIDYALCTSWQKPHNIVGEFIICTGPQSDMAAPFTVQFAYEEVGGWTIPKFRSEWHFATIAAGASVRDSTLSISFKTLEYDSPDAFDVMNISAKHNVDIAKIKEELR